MDLLGLLYCGRKVKYNLVALPHSDEADVVNINIYKEEHHSYLREQRLHVYFPRSDAKDNHHIITGGMEHGKKIGAAKIYQREVVIMAHRGVVGGPPRLRR